MTNYKVQFFSNQFSKEKFRWPHPIPKNDYESKYIAQELKYEISNYKYNQDDLYEL